MNAALAALLSMSTGMQSHAGKTIECRLYATHPQLAKQEARLRGLIAKAEKAPFLEALYKKAQVPSVEYFAYDGERKILLLEDYSSRRTRDGKEAKELIDLTKRLCQENRP